MSLTLLVGSADCCCERCYNAAAVCLWAIAPTHIHRRKSFHPVVPLRKQERDGDAVSAAAGAGATAAGWQAARNSFSECAADRPFNVMLSLRMNGNNHCWRAEDSEPGLSSRSSAASNARWTLLQPRRHANIGRSRGGESGVLRGCMRRTSMILNSAVGLTVWNLRKDTPAKIIGCLDNERQKSVDQPSQPEVEVCLLPDHAGGSVYNPITMAMDLAVRTQRPTAEMIPELRDLLRQAVSGAGELDVSTMDQIVEDSSAASGWRRNLLEIFGDRHCCFAWPDSTGCCVCGDAANAGNWACGLRWARSAGICCAGDAAGGRRC